MEKYNYMAWKKNMSFNPVLPSHCDSNCSWNSCFDLIFIDIYLVFVGRVLHYLVSLSFSTSWECVGTMGYLVGSASEFLPSVLTRDCHKGMGMGYMGAVSERVDRKWEKLGLPWGVVESEKKDSSLQVVCYRAWNETWGLKIEGKSEFEMPLWDSHASIVRRFPSRECLQVLLISTLLLKWKMWFFTEIQCALLSKYIKLFWITVEISTVYFFFCNCTFFQSGWINFLSFSVSKSG